MLFYQFKILKGYTLQNLNRWQEAKDHFLLSLKYDPNNKATKKSIGIINNFYFINNFINN